MKQYIYSIVAALALLLSSCSGDDYVNAIPDGSTALISIDLPQMAQSVKGNPSALKGLLQIDDADDCGIDYSQKIYLFETADGNLGLCAKTDNRKTAVAWMEKLSRSGVAKQPVERKGYTFSVVKDSWMVGISDEAFLVVGPVISADQGRVQQQMVKMLGQDEDESVKGTPMFDKLDSINSGVAIVAQAQALPEKFIAPFTLGAPKDADASQVLMAASMQVTSQCLSITGETFSFNKTVDKALREANRTYRKISGKYVPCMSDGALLGFFTNVDGREFIKLLQSNKGMQALLAGINTAIDMDNIIRSVDGDMSIVIPNVSDDAMQISIAAQLGSKDWLSDVDYWKSSCPKGGKIADWGKDSYFYTDGSTSFYFGVTTDNQFLSGNSEAAARTSILPSSTPLSKSVQSLIEGKRLCMVLNVKALESQTDDLASITSFLKPLFGDVNAIVYSIK